MIKKMGYKVYEVPYFQHTNHKDMGLFEVGHETVLKSILFDESTVKGDADQDHEFIDVKNFDFGKMCDDIEQDAKLLF